MFQISAVLSTAVTLPCLFVETQLSCVAEIGLTAREWLMQVAALAEHLLSWLENEQPEQAASVAEMEHQFGLAMGQPVLAIVLKQLQADYQIYLSKEGRYTVM